MSREFFLPAKGKLKDADCVHDLMIQANWIHKSAAGIYTYLPEGLRYLNSLEQICRDHMLQIGCDEVRVSSLLPINLLKSSGRLESLKSVAYSVDAKYYLGPTHEEPIVQIFKDIFNGTGKDDSILPQHLLQFQTKFRNEKRARTGLLRCREFLMQDSYSFHASAKCLNDTFFKVAKCYRDIFHYLGLKFVEVSASSGIMGGADSIEFQLISDRGEDKLLRNQSGDTFNAEIAPCYRYTPSQNSDFNSFHNIEVDHT